MTDASPLPSASSDAPIRILLVDDHTLFRSGLKALLQRQPDLQVVGEAGDGAEAVETVARLRPDVVFMDVQMPVLDGLEATRQIRRLPGRERIPILAMTANAFAEDRARCHDAGMDDHIIKPFNPEHFFAVILKWLDQAA